MINTRYRYCLSTVLKNYHITQSGISFCPRGQVAVLSTPLPLSSWPSQENFVNTRDMRVRRGGEAHRAVYMYK